MYKQKLRIIARNNLCYKGSGYQYILQSIALKIIHYLLYYLYTFIYQQNMFYNFKRILFLLSRPATQTHSKAKTNDLIKPTAPVSINSGKLIPSRRTSA